MRECERNTDKPKSCRDCVYYQPHWKHRFCYFVHCPYHLVSSTFRKKPLKYDKYPQKEVVDMDGV